MTKPHLFSIFLRKSLQSRYGLIFLLIAILVAISTATRIVLLIYSFREVSLSVVNIIGIFVLGFLYDLVNASYFIIPLTIYLWLVPQRFFEKPWHRFFVYGFLLVFTFILTFNAVSEWFFWDEFNTRFNFIAVDYLVYTNEVLGNIQQSYPVGWIITGVVLFTLALMYFLRGFIRRTVIHPTRFKRRSIITGALLMLPLILFFSVNNKFHRFSANTYVNELAGNGMYELFAAYLNNELNYDQFYSTITDKESFQTIRKLLTTPESRFVSDDPFDFTRVIENPGPEKRMNVVLISVESLSAAYMEAFGSTLGITPFLDSLANESLFFTNFYATGTRTVRGLEALSLCIPPTPGQSIVRRPNNENLFSLGSVFREKGYESRFIYGGYGYFDNMNYFFDNNGYDVADRTLLSEEDIDYENIWGVADENLFTLAERQIDGIVSEGKPFFVHIMTTSNHRPYTYPEGRIDIPSHTSRAGAVKYTDYAIGKFIKASVNKSWFPNTIIVIVADHCASSAGKTELPVDKYHIPLLIYSPANVASRKVDRLMSQIDLGPTLLGMLNFSYTSKFFGYDIFKLEEGRERAFISTYQSLGYLKHNKLVILSPQKKAVIVTPDFNGGPSAPAAMDARLLNEAIAWYQVSSYAFREGLYKQQFVSAH